MLSLALSRHVATVDHSEVEWYKYSPEYLKKYQKKYQDFMDQSENFNKTFPEGKKAMGEDVSMTNLANSHPRFADDGEVAKKTLGFHAFKGREEYIPEWKRRIAEYMRKFRK